MSYQFFGFYIVWVSVERCFRIYFSFCDLFLFIDYGLLGTWLGSSVLVELHVDGMQVNQR